MVARTGPTPQKDMRNSGHISPVYTWPTSSEPGQAPSQARCLVPIRACLHYRSGPGTAPTRSSTWPPSICAMQCVCSSLFLDFDDVTELRWPVCATTKMITLIYCILLYSRILGAIQQTNSRRGAWSFLRFCILGKN